MYGFADKQEPVQTGDFKGIDPLHRCWNRIITGRARPGRRKGELRFHWLNPKVQSRDIISVRMPMSESRLSQVARSILTGGGPGEAEFKLEAVFAGRLEAGYDWARSTASQARSRHL